MRTRILITGLMIALLAIHVSAQNGKLYPVDDASQDRSFKMFRDQLKVAVRKKDKEFILSNLDPKIELSFGGHSGIKDFKEMWKIDKPTSKFWAELTKVLQLGGSFQTVDGHKEFLAPYVTSKWPDNAELDVFEYVAVIGTDVRLRAGPGLETPIIASLSYDILKLVTVTPPANAKSKDGLDWVKVMTGDGKQGYVAGKYVRSPIDYRAAFRNIKGSWRMTAFIAGD